MEVEHHLLLISYFQALLTNEDEVSEWLDVGNVPLKKVRNNSYTIV